MNASYRLGILIVAGTVLASAGAGGGLRRRSARRTARAGPARTWATRAIELGSFRLTERSGRPVTEADLAGDVWVAAFIFTRCPIVLPPDLGGHEGAARPLGDAGVRLVSLSVDPEYDTPAVLARYADGLGADPDRWWFLTGKQDEICRPDPQPVPPRRSRRTTRPTADPKAEAVRHSPRLVLVDRGNMVVGFFDSDDPEAGRGPGREGAGGKALVGPAAPGASTRRSTAPAPCS